MASAMVSSARAWAPETTRAMLRNGCPKTCSGASPASPAPSSGWTARARRPCCSVPRYWHAQPGCARALGVPVGCFVDMRVLNAGPAARRHPAHLRRGAAHCAHGRRGACACVTSARASSLMFFSHQSIRSGSVGTWAARAATVTSGLATTPGAVLW